jgi:hypothetical protein
MTEEQRLRIASAKALGYTVAPAPPPSDAVCVHGDEKYVEWAPDLEGHEEQLVELIEWLITRPEVFGWNVIMATPDWKLAIMRAVAEVSNDNS